MFTTPRSRWTALLNRDPAATDAFIYSVTTTKIYCRPNCPSRLARRANIVFHDSVEDAQRDGFRACLRCRPGLDDADPQKVAVEAACALLRGEGKEEEKWSVKALAKEVGLTESHFCRVFKKVTGMTVGAYRSKLQATVVVDTIEPGSHVSVTVPSKFSNGLEAGTPPRIISDDNGSPTMIESDMDWNTFSGGQNSSWGLEMFLDLDVGRYIYTHDPMVLAGFDGSSDPSTPSTYDGMEFVNFGSQPTNGR